MKFLKQKDYEYMLSCKIKYDYFKQTKYWFSEWKQLNPIFNYIEGKTDISRARDEFRELSAESLGYSLNQIRKLEDRCRLAEHKLKVLTDIVSESHALKHQINKDRTTTNKSRD